MEKGAYENPSPRWSPIVHLDFKPEHMMLSDYPSQAGLTENFAMYPAVKLADFGLSIDGCKSHRPQSFFPGRGTPGFFAPEQERKYHGNVRPDLNAKTNVWGVGATIMATMKLNIDTSNLNSEKRHKTKAIQHLSPKSTISPKRGTANLCGTWSQTVFNFGRPIDPRSTICSSTFGA